MPGESKLSVAGLPPGLTVGALLAAAALAVVAQLVCHRCGGMGAHATQPLAQRAHDWTAIVPRSTIVEIGRGGELMCCGTPRGQSTAAPAWLRRSSPLPTRTRSSARTRGAW